MQTFTSFHLEACHVRMVRKMVFHCLVQSFLSLVLSLIGPVPLSTEDPDVGCARCWLNEHL